MKADLRTGGGDGPERGDLRSFLRQWDVPPAPPEIEEDLRRTFRRRTTRGRPVAWLSLAAAAALALLALWRMVVTNRPEAPGPAEREAAVATPGPRAPAAVEPAPPRSAPAGKRYAPVSAARPRRPPLPLPGEAEVIVEGGQGRLLAELEWALRGVRQAAPGTSIPRIDDGPADQPVTIAAAEATDVPRYGGEWETVEAEWPYVHRSRPAGGR